MILEEETYKKFGYYPSDLSYGSGKKIVTSCDKCKELRIVERKHCGLLCRKCAQEGRKHSEDVKQKISEAHKGKVFTKKTREKMSKAKKGNFVGEKSPHWKGGPIKCECQECDKVFYAGHDQIKKGWGLYCSKACADAARVNVYIGEHSPSWKGGKIKRICQDCGKIFEVFPYLIKQGNGKYCSRSCTIIAQRRNKKPQKTQPELIFDKICKRYSLPFHFVGDGTLSLGRANPDFIHNTRKLCVEIFGDYWHSPLLNRNLRYTATLDGRREQLKAEGYKLIVFWETDLKRKDAEAFVLSLLQKEKIIKKAIEKAI